MSFRAVENKGGTHDACHLGQAPCLTYTENLRIFCDLCKNPFACGVTWPVEGNTKDVCMNCCYLVRNLDEHPLRRGRPPLLINVIRGLEEDIATRDQKVAKLEKELQEARTKVSSLLSELHDSRAWTGNLLRPNTNPDMMASSNINPFGTPFSPSPPSNSAWFLSTPAGLPATSPNLSNFPQQHDFHAPFQFKP